LDTRSVRDRFEAIGLREFFVDGNGAVRVESVLVEGQRATFYRLAVAKQPPRMSDETP
jgi:hypothetical protein